MANSYALALKTDVQLEIKHIVDRPSTLRSVKFNYTGHLREENGRPPHLPAEIQSADTIAKALGPTLHRFCRGIIADLSSSSNFLGLSEAQFHLHLVRLIYLACFLALSHVSGAVFALRFAFLRPRRPISLVISFFGCSTA
jgi:hypothetical protein